MPFPTFKGASILLMGIFRAPAENIWILLIKTADARAISSRSPRRHGSDDVVQWNVLALQPTCHHVLADGQKANSCVDREPLRRRHVARLGL
jgi:hypothetical protein